MRISAQPMSKRKALPEAALYHRTSDGRLRPVEPNQQDLPVLCGTKVAGEYCYVPQGSVATSQNVFYSVSTVLKLTQDAESKDALRRWRARVGTAEAERIRNEAISVGKAAHTYLHTYLTGEHPSPFSTQYEPYFQALKQLLPSFGASLLSEQMIVSFRYQYLGRLDQLGFYRGSLTLSDLKTSLKAKTSLDWIQDKIIQLAAYYILVKALYPVEQAALLYLIGDGSCNEFIFTSEQMALYEQLWLARLPQFRSNEEFAA